MWWKEHGLSSDTLALASCSPSFPAVPVNTKVAHGSTPRAQAESTGLEPEGLVHPQSHPAACRQPELSLFPVCRTG